MKRHFLKALTKFFGAKVPLPTAIRHNRIEDVKIAVEMKTDLNYHSLYDGQSFIYPLMTSVYYGRKEICRLLLKARADPNFKYRASFGRTIDNFGDYREYDGEYSEYFWKEFVPYYDPKCLISNDRVPPQPRRFFDLTGWKKITPTVLAFVYGEVDILEQCLSKGGRLCTAFDGDYYSFIWYFLEHPTTCHSSICELLIKYREFSVTDFEQRAFQNFCEKLEVMRRHISLSEELSKDLEKIIYLLMNYGFKRRGGETQYFFYYNGDSSTTTTSSSSTSSEGDGERFFPFCAHRKPGFDQKNQESQQQQQQQVPEQQQTENNHQQGQKLLSSQNSGLSILGMDSPSQAWKLDFSCSAGNSSSSSPTTTTPCSKNEEERDFFTSLRHNISSSTSSSSTQSSPKKLSSIRHHHHHEQQRRRLLVTKAKVEEGEEQNEFSFNFFTSRISSQGSLESNIER